MDPDPEELRAAVVFGSYDSTLGDREKARGTFREYVFYDADQIYPAYVIKYTRK